MPPTILIRSIKINGGKGNFVISFGLDQNENEYYNWYCMDIGLTVLLLILRLDDSTQPCSRHYDTWGYYTTAARPQSVIVSDLDADGDQDLITLSDGNPRVGVLKNNGDGTFDSKIEYGTGSYPKSVFAADLDRDGYSDLIVSNSLDHTVSVLRNKGDGTFYEKVDYKTGRFPNSAVAADLNGDGKLDLIAANGSGYAGGCWPVSDNSVSLLMNKDNGKFGEKIDYGAGYSPRFVIASDLDGDKDMDLAVAGYNSISILKNDGRGNFAFQGNFETGDACFSLIGSDLDGDSDIDLVTANLGDSTVSVLKNDGVARFSVPHNYSTGKHPNTVFASDFNGDKKIDLIVSEGGESRVSVLYNDGKGNFSPGSCYETWKDYTSPTSVTSADLDGDGDQDLVVTIFYMGSVAVFLSPLK